MEHQVDLEVKGEFVRLYRLMANHLRNVGFVIHSFQYSRADRKVLAMRLREKYRQ